MLFRSLEGETLFRVCVNDHEGLDLLPVSAGVGRDVAAGFRLERLFVRAHARGPEPLFVAEQSDCLAFCVRNGGDGGAVARVAWSKKRKAAHC